MTSARTLIIGGGAIGSAIASFLSSMPGSSEDIVVVERDPTYKSASSALSASSIRQQFSTALNVQLSQFGYAFMRSCDAPGATHSSVGLQDRGYLFLGQAHQVDELASRTRQARRLGTRIDEFSSAQLAQEFPWLKSDDIRYACIGREGEGWFDGYLLQQLFRRRARANGVQYLHGEITRLNVNDGHIETAVLADGTELHARRVINAGGPWSSRIARMAGVELPVRARRRTMFVVSCPNPLPPLPILIEPSGVWIRPEQRHYLCTVSPDPLSDHDDLPLDPDFGLFEDRIWPTLAARIPAFAALRVEHAWAGYYEFNTADHNGLVGQIGPENFFVATGFSGHGLMHSAGVGRGMAELLTFGQYRTLDLSPLAPARLGTGALIVESAVI